MPKDGSRLDDATQKADAGNSGDESPLAYMLRIMRDPSVKPERRDKIAFAAAPYCHARLQPVDPPRLPEEIHFTMDFGNKIKDEEDEAATEPDRDEPPTDLGKQSATVGSTG